MMVSETPGRTVDPGLLLDESTYNRMFPPGVVSLAVTVTFCPSLNIGSREGALGAVAGAAGATVLVGEVCGAAGAEAMVFGLGVT